MSHFSLATFKILSLSLTFNILIIDYNVSQSNLLWVNLAWGPVSFLYLNVHILPRFQKFSAINSFFIFSFKFLAAFGLRCCVQAFSSCGEWGLLFVIVRGLLIAVACCGARALGTRASVVVVSGLSSCGSRALVCKLSSCGTRA